MAEIGYGYGSEFQLMRFMARHRNELENEIEEQANVKGYFKWLDFDYAEDNKNSVTGDEELLGLAWLGELYDEPIVSNIKKAVDKYDLGRKSTWRNWQNWDAICKVGETLCLIEAKADLAEFKSTCKATSSKSQKSIAELLGVSTNELMKMDNYQMANRLAVANLIKANGIDVKMVYICFTNDGFGNGTKT